MCFYVLYWFQNVVVSDEEMNYLMDLRPYYSPSPYTIGPVNIQIFIIIIIIIIITCLRPRKAFDINGR
jgi:hypothetical protein